MTTDPKHPKQYSIGVDEYVFRNSTTDSNDQLKLMSLGSFSTQSGKINTPSISNTFQCIDTPTAFSISQSCDFGQSSTPRYNKANSFSSKKKRKKKRRKYHDSPSYKFACEFFRKGKVKSIMRNNTIIGEHDAKAMLSFFRDVQLNQIKETDLALRYLQGKTVSSLKRILSESNETIHRLFYYGASYDPEARLSQLLSMSNASAPGMGSLTSSQTHMLFGSISFDDYECLPTEYSTNDFGHSNVTSFDYSHAPSTSAVSAASQSLVSFIPQGQAKLNFHSNFRKKTSKTKVPPITPTQLKEEEDERFENNGDDQTCEQKVNHEKTESKSTSEGLTEPSPATAPANDPKNASNEYTKFKREVEKQKQYKQKHPHPENRNSRLPSRDSVWSETEYEKLNPFGLRPSLLSDVIDDVLKDLDVQELQEEESKRQSAQIFDPFSMSMFDDNSSDGGYVLAHEAFRASFRSTVASEETAAVDSEQRTTTFSEYLHLPTYPMQIHNPSVSLSSTVSLGSISVKPSQLIRLPTDDIERFYQTHPSILRSTSRSNGSKTIVTPEDKAELRKQEQHYQHYQRFKISPYLIAMTKNQHHYYGSTCMGSIPPVTVSPALSLVSNNGCETPLFSDDNQKNESSATPISKKKLMILHLLQNRFAPAERRTYAYSHF